jgi:hypothetical protein
MKRLRKSLGEGFSGLQKRWSEKNARRRASRNQKRFTQIANKPSSWADIAHHKRVASRDNDKSVSTKYNPSAGNIYAEQAGGKRKRRKTRRKPKRTKKTKRRSRRTRRR